MRLKLKYFIAVNVGICLFGIICIFVGINIGGSIGRPLLEAIGIGLLAAGAINILDRSLTLEPPPAPPQRIEVAAEKRIAIPEEIIKRKYKTTKVDIIGVTLTHALDEFISDSRQEIINRLLLHHLQLRLFLVHPDSQFLEQCAREINMPLSELIRRQKHAVELCVKFYGDLLHAYEEAKRRGTLDTHLTGSLQIKLLNFCPYITVYRIGEEDIYWGLYTSGSAGVELPLFKTSSTLDPSLYKHLHQHIHGLIARDQKYPDLVNMPNLGEPSLNVEMVENILGKSDILSGNGLGQLRR